MAFFDMNKNIDSHPIFYKGNLFIFNYFLNDTPFMQSTSNTIYNVAPNYNDLRNHIDADFCHIAISGDFNNIEEEFVRIVKVIEQALVLKKSTKTTFKYIVVSLNTIVHFSKMLIDHFNQNMMPKFIDIEWDTPNSEYNKVGDSLVSFGFHKITDNWYYIGIKETMNYDYLKEIENCNSDDTSNLIEETDPEEIIDRVFKDIPCE